MEDTEGDFELMSDVPVHQGEASMSMEDTDDDGVKQLSDLTKALTRITIIVAIISVFSALLAMWWCASQVAYGAFVFPLVTAPTVMVQRIRIQWLPTLREELNKLRSSVNDFAYQNVRLQAENTRLEQQANKLSGVEERISEIASKEGKNVDELKSLMKENATIQRELEELLHAQHFQALVDALLASEGKADDHISEKEMKKFMRRVKGLHINRQSSYIDEAEIRAAFEKTSMTPEALLTVTESYLESKSQEEEAGRHLDGGNLLV